MVRLACLAVILMVGCATPNSVPANVTRPKPQREATNWEHRPFPVMYVWEDVYYGHVDPEYDPEEEE